MILNIEGHEVNRVKSPIIWLAVIILVVVSSSCFSDVEDNSMFSDQQGFPSSPSAQSITGQQMEEIMPQTLIPAEIEPLPNQANPAALALQRLGFRILHIGTTISVQAPPSLWESTFNVSFQQEKKTVMAETGSEVTYLRAVTDNLVIPERLETLISEVMFVEPPEFY
jgi:hypothetical protein